MFEDDLASINTNPNHEPRKNTLRQTFARGLPMEAHELSLLFYGLMELECCWVDVQKCLLGTAKDFKQLCAILVHRFYWAGIPPGILYILIDVMKAAILPAGGVTLRLVKDLTQEDGHALLWSRSAREVQQLLPGEPEGEADGRGACSE